MKICGILNGEYIGGLISGREVLIKIIDFTEIARIGGGTRSRCRVIGFSYKVKVKVHSRTGQEGPEGE